MGANSQYRRTLRLKLDNFDPGDDWTAHPAGRWDVAYTRDDGTEIVVSVAGRGNIGRFWVSGSGCRILTVYERLWDAFTAVLIWSRVVKVPVDLLEHDPEGGSSRGGVETD